MNLSKNVVGVKELKTKFTVPFCSFCAAYIGKTVWLLLNRNTGNFTDKYGFPGLGLADMMQMLLNQTAEPENLKQKTKNIKRQSENDRSTIKLLLNQTTEVGNFKRQAENDRITPQSLQNRVFFLEAELNKLNVSKLPSSQEFSTFWKSMNQLAQNLEANEASDETYHKGYTVLYKL